MYYILIRCKEYGYDLTPFPQERRKKLQMRNSVAEPSESGADLELWKDSVKRVYGDRGMLSRGE